MFHGKSFFHFLIAVGTAFGADVSLAGKLVRAGTVARGVVEDIKYATTGNFTGKDLYGDFDQCWLLPEAAAMLARAKKELGRRDPDLTFVLYDCARPVEVQKVMWDVVKDTDKKIYVADPAKGSVHNYGCAVDLGLARIKGNTREVLEMGTGFDHFGVEAHTNDEAQMLLDGKLSREAYLNRMKLRNAMVSAGFYQLPHEWWHFDCMKLDELKSRHKPVNSLSDLRGI